MARASSTAGGGGAWSSPGRRKKRGGGAVGAREELTGEEAVRAVAGDEDHRGRSTRCLSES